MPDWLQPTVSDNLDVTLSGMFVRLAVAFVLGLLAAGVYRLTRGPGDGQQAFLATLVLLSVLIAMLTLVIGNSVARAFSLVGALAIVRFRTVMEDTRDTAFVIFAVVLGMTAGLGFWPALIGAPFVALAAFLFRQQAPPASASTLSVRLGTGHAVGPLEEALGRHLEAFQLISTATARQGAAFDLSYAVRLRRADRALALVAELNALPGVQNVELRQGFG